MRCLGTFNNRRQLRVSDTSDLSGNANRTGADADSHDVRAGAKQTLRSLWSAYTARHDNGFGVLSPKTRDKFWQVRNISIGDFNRDFRNGRLVLSGLQALEVRGCYTNREERI